jgi:hypothetical protein
MSVTPEDLMLFADGELDEASAERVGREVAADPALAAQVAAHRALRAQLGAHFAPVLEEPVPESLADPLNEARRVVDFAAERERRAARNRLVWRFAGPALAASLLVMLLVPRLSGPPAGYARGELASALDTRLSGAGMGDTRLLLSFRNAQGNACRAYGTASGDGIACHDDKGWKIIQRSGADEVQTTQYQQAGSTDAAVMAAVQDMAVGAALSPDQEAAARKDGWKPQPR